VLQWVTRDYFCLASQSLSTILAEAVPTVQATEPTQAFWGYCFQDSHVHHYKRSTPALRQLFQERNDACGVFAAILPGETADQAIVFTDPLGQHPVFYYQGPSGFAVSNNWWWLARLPRLQLNQACLGDYVTYQGPLLQETLLDGITRLGPGQYLKLKGNSCQVKEFAWPSEQWWDMPFAELFAAGVDRLLERGKQLLAVAQPTAHLTGGMDSRLSFAALAKHGFRGPVFSLTMPGLADHQVLTELCQRWHLTTGPAQRQPDITNANFFSDLLSFNSIKSNSWFNGQSAENLNHCETTGYYSEGLIKAFGNFWGRGGALAMFNWGKQTSVFPATVFDASLSRARQEVKHWLTVTEGNRPVTEQLHYLANRCAHHCGMQSVVSNRSYLSVDLLYDPMLLVLLSKAPYNHGQMRQGALVMDLIKATHSADLAYHRYANRRIDPYNSYSQQYASSNFNNCFNPNPLPTQPMPDLTAYELTDQALCNQLAALSPLPNEALIRRTLPQLCAHPLFDEFFAAYPEFQAGRNPAGNPRRSNEIASLAALAGLVYLIHHGTAKDLTFR
jgi:hypothetical protein